ncbi:MAG: molybdopterin-synthase adenylyltransferase MoeB [Pseudomonadota bacterium]|nr:molybdopterin-synthase adenylyltransferase MoeB [Pseudomonadota bacterium]
MDFTDDQLHRYARHIVLPEVGGVGQAKLMRARVLVIGAGGLGAPLLMYLAAAGIGVIGVVDDDVVDLSNLQRQVIHGTGQIGRAKVESARAAVADINPEIEIIAHQERVTARNVMELIADYDVVADGSDNFETRFLLNDACHLSGKILVSAAILRFEGQLATFKSGLGKEFPCYRCLYRDPPPPGMIPSCAEGGVLGALAGVMGSLQTTEILKEIMEIGNSMAGSLLIYDALNTTFRNMKLKPDPGCPLCGDALSITDLSNHLG